MAESHKVRNEYFKAAERHLAVCKELQKQIKVFQEKEGRGSSLSKMEELLKKQLLCDLYYLTGYVIECSCCTVIYHFFPNLSDKKDLKKTAPDPKYKKVIFKIGQNDPDRHSYFCIADKDHKLVNFTKAFLKDFLNKNINIPLLNGETHIFQKNNCLDLYSAYEAEVRYAKTEGIVINDTNCFGFLKAAERIFEKSKSYCNIKP